MNIISHLNDTYTHGVNLQEHSNISKCNEKKSLHELPLDLMVTISECLDLFDCLRFRATCKTIQSSIPAIEWRASPLLLDKTRDSDNLCKLRHPYSDSTSMKIQDPYLCQVYTKIMFSKGGWLVLQLDDDSLLFYNPFTRVRRDLPPCDPDHHLYCIGFSTCPSSPDCVTVGFFCHAKQLNICFLQASNDTWRWRYCQFKPDCDGWRFGFYCACSPVYHKGAFYFLFSGSRLGVFTVLEGGETSWEYYEPPSMEDDILRLLHACHLVECDGELLAIFIRIMGRQVKVLRWNYLMKSWAEITSLGNYNVFLCDTSSFSVMERGSEMNNRIYMRMYKGNCIVFYSLETGKYHTCGDSGPMDDFSGLCNLHLNVSCWI